MPPTERNLPTSSTLHPWLGVSQNAGSVGHCCFPTLMLVSLVHRPTVRVSCEIKDERRPDEQR